MTSSPRPPLTPYVPEEGVVIMRRCDVPDHPDVEVRWGEAGSWCPPLPPPDVRPDLVWVRYRPERQVTLTVSESTARDFAAASDASWLHASTREFMVAAKAALAALDGGS